MYLWLIEHLRAQGGAYIVSAVAFLVCGALMGSIGQQWLDTRIDGRIQVKLSGIAEDVSHLKGGLQSVQELTISSQIVELQRQLCLSPGNGFIIRQLEDLQRQYQQLKGSRYPHTPCEVLIPRG